jgi:uncharacterized protein YdhG (YjbR/CyaY superfamily)
MSSAVGVALKEELKSLRTCKGTVQFRIENPLPATLVEKLVKAGLTEKDARKAGHPPSRRSLSNPRLARPS